MTPRGMLIKADVRRPVEVLFTVRLLDNVTNRLHMQELVERVSLVWREGLVIACFIEEEGCGVNESARYEIDLLRWLGLPRCGITESCCVEC